MTLNVTGCGSCKRCFIHTGKNPIMAKSNPVAASGDLRSVHTDALGTIGMILGEKAHRDAIHLAVEPVTSLMALYPGQHVGWENMDLRLVTAGAKDGFIGIVDPFLVGRIEPGQKFWLVVYPRTITSLRHVWEHPNFLPSEFQAAPEKVEPTPKELSQAWINAFADRIKQHPDALMRAAERWVHSGDYTYDNNENYKDAWGEFEEFWNHYEVVTGTIVKEKDSFFTCSC